MELFHGAMGTGLAVSGKAWRADKVYEMSFSQGVATSALENARQFHWFQPVERVKRNHATGWDMARLTLERLRQVIHYDPATGRCLNRQTMARIGHRGRGHRRIRIDDKVYLARRLVWFYNFGKWPDCDLKHANGYDDDLRICNLVEIRVEQ